MTLNAKGKPIATIHPVSRRKALKIAAAVPRSAINPRFQPSAAPPVPPAPTTPTSSTMA